MATQVENTAAVEAPAGTSVSSGTASEAMIKAAGAASSAAAQPAGGADAGDTTKLAGAEAAPVTKPVATAQAASTGPAAATANRGEAPEPRIVAAVRNAREEVEGRYAWAKDLNPADVQNAMSIFREMRMDLAGFLRRAASETGLRIADNEQEKPWEMPGGRLRSEDGTAAYSVDEVKDIIAHMRQELTEQLKPLSQFRDDTTRAASMQQRVAESRERVSHALTAARALPHFKEHEEKIAEKVRAIDPETRNQVGVIGCLHMAYSQVMADTVIPGIESGAAQRVREENERKAATSTGTVRPGGSSADGGKVPRLDNVRDLATHMARMAQAEA